MGKCVKKLFPLALAAICLTAPASAQTLIVVSACTPARYSDGDGGLSLC
jgi:hypothetical protein